MTQQHPQHSCGHGPAFLVLTGPGLKRLRRLEGKCLAHSAPGIAHLALQHRVIRSLLGQRLGAALGALLLLMTSGALPITAQAGWFKNSEQEAVAAYESGAYSSAAAAFSDPFRRGVALYRAGRYAEAEAAFSKPQRSAVSTEAEYNLGNARFAQGDYVGAISAYEEVLSAEPTHDDAAHNLALARARLARLEQEAFAEEEELDLEKDPKTAQSADVDEPPDASDDAADQDESADESEQQASEQDQAQEQSEQQQGEQEQESEPDDQGEQEGEQEEGEQEQDVQQGQDSGSEQQGEAQDQASDAASGEQGADAQQSGASGGDEQREPQGEAESGERSETNQGGSDDESASGQIGDPDDPEQEPAQEQGQRQDIQRASEESGSDAQQSEDQTGEQGDVSKEALSARSESDKDQAGADASTAQDRQQRAVGDNDEVNPDGRETNDIDLTDQRAEGDESVDQDASAATDEHSGEDQQRPVQDSSEGGERANTDGERAAQASDRPDLSAADQAAESIDRFDQQGALPWQTLDPEQGISDQPSLDGEAVLGRGMAIIEQRLQQVEGDPTRLIRNQFRLEEARRLRESGGPLQEARPW